MSFKYGQHQRSCDNRIFYDMNEELILSYLQNLFTPLEIWTTEDTRSKNPSPNHKWLNILVRK